MVIILRGLVENMEVDNMEEIIFSQNFLVSVVNIVWRYLDPTPV